MLEGLDVDHCSLTGVSEDIRDGRAQNNAVRVKLEQVLKRGDPEELNSFCAALTDIVASADEHGDWYRGFAELADKRTGPA